VQQTILGLRVYIEVADALLQLLLQLLQALLFLLYKHARHSNILETSNAAIVV